MFCQPVLRPVKKGAGNRRTVRKSRGHHFHAFGEPRIEGFRALKLDPKCVQFEVVPASDPMESTYRQVVANVMHNQQGKSICGTLPLLALFHGEHDLGAFCTGVGASLPWDSERLLRMVTIYEAKDLLVSLVIIELRGPARREFYHALHDAWREID